MMWKVFRTLKSWSETSVTAGEAVVELMPLFRPKAVEEGLRYPVQKAGLFATQG
jgi:hypothetical protein